MTQLRKEEIAVRRDPDLNETEKKLQIDNILAARDQLATEFNRAYRESLEVKD